METNIRLYIFAWTNLLLIKYTLGASYLLCVTRVPTGIYRVSPSSGRREALAVTSDYPYAVTFDPVGRHLYWTDLYRHVILQVVLPLQGTPTAQDPVEEFKPASSGRPGDPVNDLQGVAVDGQTGYVYYIVNDVNGKNIIARLNIQNLEEQIIVDTGMAQPMAIALDSKQGYIYWIDYMEHKVERSKLDGSSREKLFSASGLMGLALDDDRSWLFFCDYGGNFYSHDIKMNQTSVIHTLPSKKSCHSMTYQNGRLYYGFHGGIKYLSPDSDDPKAAWTSGFVWSQPGISVYGLHAYTDNTTESVPSHTTVDPQMQTQEALSTTYMPMGDEDPALFPISPTNGPQAGGTPLSLSGGIQIERDAVQLVTAESPEATHTICYVMPRIVMEIICQTLPLPDEKAGLLNKELPISIVTTDKRIPTEATFTYRNNPVIYEVYPMDSIAKGGIQLTIKGINLDSTSQPVMETKLFCGGEKIATLHTHCGDVTSTEMTCPTPDIESALDMKCNEDNEQDNVLDVEAFIGFLFDNFDEYQDLRDHEDLSEFSSVMYHDNPTFAVQDQAFLARPFPPYQHETIDIQGQSLMFGEEADEAYQVFIGNQQCTVTSVDDDVITCEPPSVRPASGNTVPIAVTVGNCNFSIGEIQYLTPVDTPFYQGVIAGGLILALALLLLMVFLFWRSRRDHHSQREPKVRESYHPDGETYAARPPSRENLGLFPSKYLHPRIKNQPSDGYLKPSDVPDDQNVKSVIKSNARSSNQSGPSNDSELPLNKLGEDSPKSDYDNPALLNQSNGDQSGNDHRTVSNHSVDPLKHDSHLVDGYFDLSNPRPSNQPGTVHSRSSDQQAGAQPRSSNQPSTTRPRSSTQPGKAYLELEAQAEDHLKHASHLEDGYLDMENHARPSNEPTKSHPISSDQPRHSNPRSSNQPSHAYLELENHPIDYHQQVSHSDDGYLDLGNEPYDDYLSPVSVSDPEKGVKPSQDPLTDAPDTYVIASF